MRRVAVLAVLLAVAAGLLATGCGPAHVTRDGGDGDGDGGVDARPGDVATVTGRVWAPNQAPGLAPPGEEIPIFGALVHLTTQEPGGVPAGVHCERCRGLPAGGVRSAHDGSFTLAAVPGDYWLVIEKAQFRLVQRITLAAGARALPAGDTTLPSTHDPAHGQWIPRIAVAAGTDDQIEDVLGKLRLGTVGPDNRFAATNDELDIYDNGFPPVTAIGPVAELLADLDAMRQYHIILFPCSDEDMAMLRDPVIQQNLRTYVREGGKLYVTDFAGEVMDIPFPPQITLGGAGADTVGTYQPGDPAAGEITTYGTASGRSYTADDGRVVDPDLAAWLGLQSGPTPLDATPSGFDPDDLDIVGNHNYVAALTDVLVGVDADGNDVFDRPRVWIEGSGALADGIRRPLSVTFEPTGCGRVMYSTYHTTNGAHPGLYPQERALLYLIMELGTCHPGPVIE